MYSFNLPPLDQQVLSIGLLISASIYLSALTKVSNIEQTQKLNCSDVKAEPKTDVVADDTEYKIIVCKVIDYWALYMTIGVTCIISSAFAILCTCFNIEMTNTLSSAAYIIPSGMCCILMLFTGIFSLNFMIYLPFLTKSMVATFAFCVPGCAVFFTILLYSARDCIKKMQWQRI